MNLIEKYKLELNELKTNKNILSIIIFGSVATNTITALSDLDVAILTKKSLSKNEKREILSFGDEMLDISLFEELPLSLQFKILTEGQVFYTIQDLSNLKNKIANNWFDFKVGLNKLYKNRGFRGLET